MEKKKEGNHLNNETWNEIYTVTLDVPQKLAIIEDINVEKEKVHEDRIAICDYCNNQMGKFSELKDENIISPEKFAKAVKNGLIPPEEQLAMYKSLGDEEFLKIIIENWKTMALHSQTPWALCDKCKEIVVRFIEKG